MREGRMYFRTVESVDLLPSRHYTDLREDREVM